MRTKKEQLEIPGAKLWLCALLSLTETLEARDISETLENLQNLQRCKTKVKFVPEWQLVYLSVF